MKALEVLLSTCTVGNYACKRFWLWLETSKLISYLLSFFPSVSAHTQKYTHSQLIHSLSITHTHILTHTSQPEQQPEAHGSKAEWTQKSSRTRAGICFLMHNNSETQEENCSHCNDATTSCCSSISCRCRRVGGSLSGSEWQLSITEMGEASTSLENHAAWSKKWTLNPDNTLLHPASSSSFHDFTDFLWFYTHWCPMWRAVAAELTDLRVPVSTVLQGHRTARKNHELPSTRQSSIYWAGKKGKQSWCRCAFK